MSRQTLLPGGSSGPPGTRIQSANAQCNGRQTFRVLLGLYIAAAMLVGKSSLARFGLVTGNTSYTAMVALIVGSGVLLLLNTALREGTLRKPTYESAMAMLLAVYVMAAPLRTSIVGPGAVVAFAFSGFVIWMVVVGHVMWRDVRWIVEGIGWLSHGLVAGAFILLAVGGFQGRMAFLGGPNVFVRFCAFSMIWTYLTIRNLLISLMALLPPAIGILLSGSRQGGLFLVLLSSIVLIRIFVRLWSAKAVKTVMVASTVVVAGLGAFLTSDRLQDYPFGSSIQARAVQGVMTRTFWFDFETSRSTQARVKNLAVAQELFSEAPVLGVGPGGFQAVRGANQPYPHNLFAELLSEYGLIGIGLTTLILIGATFRMSKSRRWRHRTSALAASFGLAALFFSLFSGQIYDSRLVYAFAIMIGVTTREDGNVRRGRISKIAG